MSAGAKPKINLSNPSEADRFRKMADDVSKGRLPIGVMADEFDVSTKTIRRNIDALKNEDQASATYRSVDSWKHLPRIDKFEAWVHSRGNTPKSKAMNFDLLMVCERIWSEAWNKKNLSLLTEDDMVAFENWKDKQLRPDGFPQNRN